MSHHSQQRIIANGYEIDFTALFLLRSFHINKVYVAKVFRKTYSARYSSDELKEIILFVYLNRNPFCIHSQISYEHIMIQKCQRQSTHQLYTLNRETKTNVSHYSQFYCQLLCGKQIILCD